MSRAPDIPVEANEFIPKCSRCSNRINFTNQNANLSHVERGRNQKNRFERWKCKWIHILIAFAETRISMTILCLTFCLTFRGETSHVMSRLWERDTYFQCCSSTFSLSRSQRMFVASFLRRKRVNRIWESNRHNNRKHAKTFLMNCVPLRSTVSQSETRLAIRISTNRWREQKSTRKKITRTASKQSRHLRQRAHNESVINLLENLFKSIFTERGAARHCQNILIDATKRLRRRWRLTTATTKCWSWWAETTAHNKSLDGFSVNAYAPSSRSIMRSSLPNCLKHKTAIFFSTNRINWYSISKWSAWRCHIGHILRNIFTNNLSK